MTTKVDINVNVGGLLAKALQQTLANREALVVREGQAKAEERGVKERRAQRIREGRDPETGDPLPSRGGQGRFGSDVQRIDEEPAANRRGGLEIMGAHIDFNDSIVDITSPNSGITRRYKMGEPSDAGNLGNLAAEAGLFLGNTQELIVDEQWSQGCNLLGGLKFEEDPAFCTGGDSGCCRNPCWDEWVGGRTRTWRFEYGSVTTNAIGSYIRLVLPYSKDFLVACFLYTYEVYAHYTYGRNEVTDFDSLRITGTSASICAGSGLGHVQRLTTASTQTSTTLLTSRRQDPEFLSVLVGREDSREIFTPAAVKSLLMDYSAASWSSSDRQEVVRTFAQGSGTLYVFPGETTTSMEERTVEQTFRTFSREGTIYTPSGNFARFPSAGSITTTPAIYATLADSNIRDVDSALAGPSRILDFLNYYIFGPASKIFRKVDKLPYLTVSRAPDASASSSRSYEIEIKPQRSIIEDADDGKKIKKLNFNVPVNVLTWNWNDKAFCKGRLQSLGFPARDLEFRPTDPPGPMPS